MYTKWNVLYILFCPVDFSQQKRLKHGHSLLARRAIPEYPSFTWYFSHSGTWRRVLFFLPKGAGHGTCSLVTGAVLSLRIKSLDISDLRNAEFSKVIKKTFSKPKTYGNVLLQKNGAWHGPSDSGLLVRWATPERPAFTLITSGTMERGDVYFSLYQKRGGVRTQSCHRRSL